jgi:hypothetical protein
VNDNRRKLSRNISNHRNRKSEPNP